jgi:hypothetical protein
VSYNLYRGLTILAPPQHRHLGQAEQRLGAQLAAAS